MFILGLLLPLANQHGALAGLLASAGFNCALGFGSFLAGTRALPLGHVNINVTSPSCHVINSTNSDEELSAYFEQFPLTDSFNRVADRSGLGAIWEFWDY